MALTAKYLFIVSMDVEPEYEDLFNDVYDREHVPNICKVPGVITAYRLKLEEAELSVGIHRVQTALLSNPQFTSRGVRQDRERH